MRASPESTPIRGRSEPSDPLDDEIWRRLGFILAAGHRGDADGLGEGWLDLEKSVSGDQRRMAGVYVWYFLYYRVVEILGRRPSKEDLHDIAARARPLYTRLIRGDGQLLEDTLRSVFVAPEQRISGGMFLVSSSAVMSALLDDPAAQLQEMRDPLARWYARNAARLRELGILSMLDSES